MANITQDEQQAVKEEVLRRLLERHKLGSLNSELDFIAGAVAVMTFLLQGEEGDGQWAPAVQWYFSAVGGRSIVADYLEGQGKDKQAELVRKSTTRRIKQRQASDKLAAFPRTIHEILRTAGTYRGVLLLPADTVEWMQTEARDLLEELGYWEEDEDED